jgi:hypothetical protein
MTVAELEAQKAANGESSISVDESAAVPSTWYLSLDGEDVEVCEHAYERHGTEVGVAVAAAANCGVGCRYQCDDARVRYVAPTTINGVQKWVVVIRAGLHGKVITAFVSDRKDYLVKILTENNCENGYGEKHPWSY